MSSKFDLYNILYSAASNAIQSQNKNGSFPSGSNGPYNHSETPVRNTAHWLTLLCRLTEIGKLDKNEEEKFRVSALMAVEYLLSKNSRPFMKSFYCRQAEGKDTCNGLIGQAWAIEGLLSAFKVFKIEEARKTALEVFLLHPFDFKKGIWKRVEVNGDILSFDFTFNHQLWFAATAIQIEDSNINKLINRFFDLVVQNIETYSDGTVFHATKLGNFNFFKKDEFFRSLINLLDKFKKKKIKKSLYSKSIGYHAFNLYALAIIKEYLPNHIFWNSEIFLKMLSVTRSEKFIHNLDQGPYGWSYNPSGIELAYVGLIFSLGEKYVQQWLSLQYEKTFDFNTKNLMTKGSDDIITSSARIYEASRIIKVI